MKKSVRFFISGNLQPLFFNNFIKENADKIGVKGFVRAMDDGRMEIFVEGNLDDVKAMAEVCKRGPKHAQLRNIEEREASFQGFKDFKVLKI